mmetsp:Transcript_26264/g.56317  ORF Transcript_26264/g.56317 Transcript_26264/m.56317 type:complete len:191 (+) Transcript_26264:102-674(+)
MQTLMTMQTSEILPIRSHIFIPENKLSAWVSQKGSDVARDENKKHQGVWVVDKYTLDKKLDSVEVWIFFDDDEIGIDPRVLENNPTQGTWGYAPKADPDKAGPQDMWFFPPKSAKCKILSSKKKYNHKGTWIKPTFKRELGPVGSRGLGFIAASGNMKIAKGEKHSVAGKWNMLGYNDDVVRGRKKEEKL